MPSVNPTVDQISDLEARLKGRTFGDWFVVSRHRPNWEDKKGRQFDAWNVRCVCGHEKVLSGNDLRSFHSLSCGCKNWQKTTGLKKPAYIELFARPAAAKEAENARNSAPEPL